VDTLNSMHGNKAFSVLRRGGECGRRDAGCWILFFA